MSTSLNKQNTSKNPIIVETYKSHDQPLIISIDEALDKVNYFRID